MPPKIWLHTKSHPLCIISRASPHPWTLMLAHKVHVVVDVAPHIIPWWHYPVLSTWTLPSTPSPQCQVMMGRLTQPKMQCSNSVVATILEEKVQTQGSYEPHDDYNYVPYQIHKTPMTCSCSMDACVTKNHNICLWKNIRELDHGGGTCSKLQ